MVITNGTKIIVDTAKITTKNYKVDMLFYNSVLKGGSTVRTMVYNSGLKVASSTDPIVYNPSYIRNNSTIEKSYNISGNSYRWVNADFNTSTLNIVLQNAVNEDMIDMGLYKPTIVYDGWYTVASIGLSEYTNVQNVVAGTLRYNTLNGNLEYAIVDNPASATDWSDISLIDSTVPIAEASLATPASDITTNDIFVYLKTRSLLNDLLGREMDREQFLLSDILKARIDSIEFAIKNNRYDAAKYLLSSIDTQTTTLII